MIAIAKERHCIVVVSSSDSADHVDEYLSHGADYVIKGEGEMTLLDLCTGILKSTGSNSREIQGLSFLESGRVVETIPRRPIRDLDSLPLPRGTLST